MPCPLTLPSTVSAWEDTGRHEPSNHRRHYNNPACATTGEGQPSQPSSEPPGPIIPPLELTAYMCYGHSEDEEDGLLFRKNFGMSMKVLPDLPRTNNSIEGWHITFDLRVTIKHPTLCRLVDRLRNEQADNELLIDHANAGVVLPTNKKYEYVNQCLKNLVEKYDTSLVLEYLRGIAHNL
ncbi:hypothetical protein GWK47_042004 [Chionoecetes opilio]|uniref:Uncharacterized protein n=1 Tax=Chionoecetes opilio TaxID=41210 RepID=A0A8J4YGG0_CHIOP|nr:hypothetical protein GWK47_042004 [Chionoecetes opilio]